MISLFLALLAAWLLGFVIGTWWTGREPDIHDVCKASGCHLFND